MADRTEVESDSQAFPLPKLSKNEVVVLCVALVFAIAVASGFVGQFSTREANTFMCGMGYAALWGGLIASIVWLKRKK